MVGLRRLAGRIWSGFVAVFWLATLTPAVYAGQGGGQVQPAADNTYLLVVGGLVVVMLAAGLGLLYTRRKK